MPEEESKPYLRMDYENGRLFVRRDVLRLIRRARRIMEEGDYAVIEEVPVNELNTVFAGNPEAPPCRPPNEGS